MRHSALYLAGILFLTTKSLASSEEKTKCSARRYPVHINSKDQLLMDCSTEKVDHVVLKYIQDKCYTMDSQIPTLFTASIMCGDPIETIAREWECPDRLSAVQLNSQKLEKIRRTLKALVNTDQCFFNIVEEVLNQLRKKKIQCPVAGSSHYLNVINVEVQRQLEMKDRCVRFEERLAQALTIWADSTQNFVNPGELMTKELWATRAKMPPPRPAGVDA